MLPPRLPLMKVLSSKWHRIGLRGRAAILRPRVPPGACLPFRRATRARAARRTAPRAQARLDYLRCLDKRCAASFCRHYPAQAAPRIAGRVQRLASRLSESRPAAFDSYFASSPTATAHDFRPARSASMGIAAALAERRRWRVQEAGTRATSHHKIAGCRILLPRDCRYFGGAGDITATFLFSAYSLISTYADCRAR